ncbi:MAG: hypothetical protein ACLU8F_01830 [Clostridia bacterium]
MNYSSELKKNGIEVIKQLDTLKVYKIAATIAKKLAISFQEYNLDENAIFDRLSSLHMYIARMPEGMAEANYFYKNSSVYFNSVMDLSQMDSFAMHECIHYLQEVKNKRGKLLRLGLCKFTNFHTHGMGLNEAAVQLATSKAIGYKEDVVKYYGIELHTISPSYYPLECSILSQMAYITGETSLFYSTFFSTDEFQNKFIGLTTEKTYHNIENNLDTLLDLESKLTVLNSQIPYEEDMAYMKKLTKKAENLKEEIKQLYIQTQNLIIVSYFDKAFDNLHTTEELEDYRRSLYNFKDMLGTIENYDFFNNYYIDKMAQLDGKYSEIENGITGLIVVKKSRLSLFLQSLKNLLGIRSKDAIEIESK